MDANGLKRAVEHILRGDAGDITSRFNVQNLRTECAVEAPAAKGEKFKVTVNLLDGDKPVSEGAVGLMQSRFNRYLGNGVQTSVQSVPKPQI